MMICSLVLHTVAPTPYLDLPLPAVRSGALIFTAGNTLVGFSPVFLALPELVLSICGYTQSVNNMGFSVSSKTVSTSDFSINLVGLLANPVFSVQYSYFAFSRIDFSSYSFSILSFSPTASVYFYYVSINNPVTYGSTTIFSLFSFQTTQISSYNGLFHSVTMYSYSTSVTTVAYRMGPQFNYNSIKGSLLYFDSTSLTAKSEKFYTSYMTYSSSYSQSYVYLTAQKLASDTLLNSLLISLEILYSAGTSVQVEFRNVGLQLRIYTLSSFCTINNFQYRYFRFNKVCLQNSYDSGTDCVSCTQPCVTCSSPSICLSCNSAQFRILPASGCLCSPGYFQAGATACSPCDYSCKTCSSALVCLTCETLNNRALNVNSCICNAGYFEQRVSSCTPCDPNCLQCNIKSTICLQCNSDKWLDALVFRCEPDCPLGQFRFIPTKCQPCLAKCNSCVSADTCFFCNQPYWFNVIQKTCDPNCPSGQFYSVLKGLCQLCSAACLECTLLKCTVCNSGYMSYGQGKCYKCRCSDCSDCKEICPALTYQMGVRCFSNCPDESFVKLDKCKACQPPCKNCVSEQYCLSCRNQLYLHKTTCVEKCPYNFYSKDDKCQPCILNQVYLKHIEQCNSTYPRFLHAFNCPHSFGVSSFQIDFTANRPILLSSGKVELTFSKAQCVAEMITRSEFKVSLQMKNRDCNLVKQSILVKLSEFLTSDNQSIEFQRYQLTTNWPLSLPQTSIPLLFKSIDNLDYVLSYLRFFPLFYLLFPQLATMALLPIVYELPYNAHQFAKLFSNQIIELGCFEMEFNGANLLEKAFLGERRNKNVGEHAKMSMSNLFILDFMPGIIWIAVSWLLVLIVKLSAPQSPVFAELAEQIQLRVHRLFLAIGMMALTFQLRSVRLSSGVEWASLLSCIVFLGYLVFFMALKANQVYGEVLSLTSQFQYKRIVKKIDTCLQNNSSSGVLHALDPVYFEILQILSDALAISLTVLLLGNPLPCFAVLLTFNFINLARLFKLPYFPEYLNFVSGFRYLLLASFSVLGYLSKLKSTEGRVLEQTSYSEWLNRGSALIAIYALIILTSIVQQSLKVLVKDQLRQYKLQEQDQLTLIQESNVRDKLSQRMSEPDHSSRTIFEVEYLTAVLSNEVFSLKVVGVNEVQKSQVKYHLSKSEIVAVKANKYYIRLSEGNPIWKDLKRLTSSEVKIKTMAVIDEGKEMFFWNIVSSQNKTFELKGERALTWCPLTLRINQGRVL